MEITNVQRDRFLEKLQRAVLNELKIRKSDGADLNDVLPFVTGTCVDFAVDTFASLYEFTDADREEFRDQIRRSFGSGIQSFAFGARDGSEQSQS